MYVEANDIRPPSLLSSNGVNGLAFIGGALTTMLAHFAIPVIGMTVISFFGLLEIKPQHSLPSIPEEHIIEARFVKIGKKPDPRKLPNRRVPRKSTAPDKKIVVSKEMAPDPPEPKKDDSKPPDNAQEDLLTRLGDRAQAFAEIAEKREQEGDPDGVEWGTETEAREGDIYRGKLVAFFKRGWTVPTTIPEKEIRSMITKVSVQITRELLIGSFIITATSGNPLFDQAVTDHLNQLRQAQSAIPPPPEPVADQFLGQRLTIRFRGRDL